jgi:REP element-mobilizing transposase RayT
MRSVPPRGSGWVKTRHTYQSVRTTSSCRCLTDVGNRCQYSWHQRSPRVDLKELPILIMWNDTDTPLAYFISFRSYGTWLHGDKRGSIDRFHNQYRSPYIPPNENWRRYNQQQLKTKPLILKAAPRKAIEIAIRETCRIREWDLLAFNVRTNHVHTVVTANRKASLVLNAFKANATRELRETRLWLNDFSPWADKGSKRKLWNEKSVQRAIEYVLYGQGDELPDFDG